MRAKDITKDIVTMLVVIAGLVLVLGAIFYLFGRRDERVATLEARLALAEGDLRELKQAKVQQEAQWSWLKRIGQGARALLTWGK